MSDSDKEILNYPKYLKIASKVRWMRSFIKRLKDRILSYPRYTLTVTVENEKNMEPVEFIRYYNDLNDIRNDIGKCNERISGNKNGYLWDKDLLPKDLLSGSFRIDRFWFTVNEIPSSVHNYSEDEDDDDMYGLFANKKYKEKLQNDVNSWFEKNFPKK